MNIKVDFGNANINEKEIMRFEKEVQNFSKDLEARASK